MASRLGSLESQYLIACRARVEEERKRQVRQARMIRWGATVAFVVIAVFAGFAVMQWQEAEFLTIAANGARVSALAELPNRATEALVSGVQLVAPIVKSRESVPPQVTQGLADAIVAVGFSVPKVHVMRGHEGKVESITISPDGNLVSSITIPLASCVAPDSAG